MSDQEYRVAYLGLRLQARAHGLNPNKEKFMRFLKQTAEVMAQDRVQLREAMSREHNLLTS